MPHFKIGVDSKNDRQMTVIRDGKQFDFVLPEGKGSSDFMKGFFEWEKGEFIQKALGFLTADQREFIMTGITPEEWKELFGEEGEENEGD